jgi:glycerol-3-phosphate acyltransferase PlsY
MSWALSFVAAYLIGSIPFGLIVSRWWAGIDIRRYGTGNIGASNVLRHLGPVPAGVVGLASFLQGFLPAWLAGRLTGSALCVGLAAVGAVLGYGWSVFLRLRGGSAVGTATGALAAIWPPGLVPLLVLYMAGGVIRRPAPSVLLGLLAYLVAMWIGSGSSLLLVAAALVVLAVILKRLDGVGEDLRGPRPVAVLRDRLIHARRPGRGLVGRLD